MLTVSITLVGKQHHACYKCPCGHTHCIPVVDGPPPADKQHVWGWNGNTEKPTFKPSIRTWRDDKDGKTIWQCHSNVIDGIAQFCGDSTHEHAGKHVPLLEWKSLFD